jgi:hypothetical protein
MLEINKLAPPLAEALFFLSTVLILADWKELTCQLYPIGFHKVRWVGGLTCDFWAEFEEDFFG